MRRERATHVMTRLMNMVVINDHGCWVYPRHRLGDGYAQVGIVSKTDGTRRMSYVHRITYEHLVGPIPAGLDMDHLCRNRACCNPLHLEPVTRKENLRRGVGIGAASGAIARAKQLAKTHCPSGHPYSGSNLYLRKNGYRDCKECNRASWRRWRLCLIDSAAHINVPVEDCVAGVLGDARKAIAKAKGDL